MKKGDFTMNEHGNSTNISAIMARKKLSTQFRRKGIAISIISGLSYGFFSAFITLGMSSGVWTDWNTTLSTFFIVFVLGALGSGINDIFSAVWSLINIIKKGKIGDFFRTSITTPGLVIVFAAFIGGPIANVAYVIALQTAGSITIPITALSSAVGAILGKILFKQELNKRMVLGISICILASILIGSTGLSVTASKEMFIGIIVALIAALGWGFEGCVAGYGTAIVDPEIAITIRQITSGVVNLAILIPLLCFIGGDIGLSTKLISEAFLSGSSIPWFIISGFFTLFGYMFWYKGNGMCGAALGMACNGMYSFWGPFCCWIILGVVFGRDGWSLPMIAWISAIVMVVGISLIAANPSDYFRKKEGI